VGFWIALFITLAVLGSVLWVMPSPREKAIIMMRGKALSLGIKVRLVDQNLALSWFPWLDNYRSYTLYEKLNPTALKSGSHKARVLRLTVDPNAHELDAEDPIRQSLFSSGVFKGLPETVEALVITSGSVALLWREQQADNKLTEEVERIAVCLDSCIEVIVL